MQVVFRLTLLLFALFFCLAAAGCTGSSSETDTLSVGSDDTLAAQVGQARIPLGMSASQALKTLGQPDSIDIRQNGEAWSYERLTADFVYASGDTLVIGGLNSPAGQRFSVRILMDASRKVADFSYSQLLF